jgi:hypothetical protein
MWVVDLLNRPGTNFTDLPPAVAAAAPGDVISVRFAPSPYSAVMLTRAVTILCESSSGSLTQCAGLTIAGLPAGHGVLIRAMQATCVVRMAAGTVVLEDCRWTSLNVEDAAHAVMRGCISEIGPFTPSMSLQRSSLFAERSQFSAPSFANNSSYLGPPVVLAEDCWIGSSAVGWYGIDGSLGLHCWGWIQPRPAIELRSTSLMATRGSSLSGGHLSPGAGCANSPVCFGAIQGTGNITIDPSCSTGCSSIGLRREVPLLTTDTAVRGARSTVHCEASAGSFAILAVSQGVTAPLPTIYGDLWIDPLSFFVLTAAAVMPSVTAPLPIPTFLSLGTILTVQAAVLLPDGRITLTLPNFPAVGL